MASKKIVLHFPSSNVDKPIVYKLVKDYNLEFNILKASVTPKEEGVMVIHLKGEKKNYEEAIKYLQKEGLTIETLSQDISRNEKKCVHCGICVPLCPTHAFVVEEGTRIVHFKRDKCMACEICVTICPYKAMEIKV